MLKRIYPNLGPAEDGVYTDGLFTDLTADTPLGIFADRVNEVLLGLAPPPAPALDNLSTADSGTAGYLSFGVSHSISGYTNVSTGAGGVAIDVNGLFPNSGQRKGIFTASNIFNGVLNDDVVAHAYSYPADSFGSGNLGTLKLEVNGAVIHSVDLTTFSSGNSLNGNGSGFNLSAATFNKYSDGTNCPFWKYRTGTYTIATTDQRNGHNYCRTIHVLVSGDVNSNYFEWVNDADTSTTTYSSMSFSGLSMTGSVYLSGAQYHTGGGATYNCTISNLHRNTYSSSSTALTHPTLTNCNIPSLAIEAIASPNWEAQTQILAQTAAISGTRILDADLSASTRTDRVVQTDSTSTTTNGSYELLVDTQISGAAGQTDIAESWNAEGYRLPSNCSITSISYATGPGHGPTVWDSTISLVSATAGYLDGLLQYNGSLRYPTQGPNTGNFSTVANGPAGNPNYSAASGIRVYDRYFYVGSGKQNFTMAITATGTSFVSVATGPSGQNVTCEILAPNTTKDGGGTVEWKDAVTAYTDDASDGCYAATYGGTIPTNWGITLGTKSTATSGNAIRIRISAAAAWTGSIDSMTVTIL
jgi:hypothetical protein